MNLGHGVQCLLLALVSIPFFSACTEGYPSEDELNITPLEMNKVERLEAMNRLGQESNSELTWLYRAMPGCVLQWTVRGGDSGKETFNLPLSGAEVDISYSKEDQIYGVEVQPQEASNLSAQSVLLSKKWVGAIEMSHLIRLFQGGCRASRATLPARNSVPS